MALADSDEYGHQPTEDPTWQENYFFLAWDDDKKVGLYLHLGHLASRGVVDTRLMVSIGGRTVSAGAELQADECLGVPWVDADVVRPLDRWRIRAATQGAEPGPSGWIAQPSEPGTIDFGFNIDFSSAVPAVDWAVAWDGLGVPNIMSEHYEAGARWTGTVWIDGEGVSCSGLLVRDHSWGPRDLKNAVQLAWWLPVMFEDGSYQTGASLLRNGRWVGFLLEERGDGAQLISTDPVVVVDGLQRVRGFESATLLRTRDGNAERVARYEARLHAPVVYETMGSHRIDDVFSIVTAGDGRRGFGTMELNLPDA